MMTKRKKKKMERKNVGEFTWLKAKNHKLQVAWHIMRDQHVFYEKQIEKKDNYYFKNEKKKIPQKKITYKQSQVVPAYGCDSRRPFGYFLFHVGVLGLCW